MKKTTVVASGILTAFLCILLFTQCKKSDDTNKSQLLKSSAWKYKEGGLDLDNNGTGETPFPTGTVQTCDIDNTVTFRTDTSGMVDEGATICPTTPPTPQTTSFKYTYNTTTNTLNFSTAIIAGLSGDVKVLDISSTQLKLSKAVPVTGLPTAVTVVVTLVH